MAGEKITGIDILVKIDDESIGGQRNCTLALNSAGVDVTSKDSEGFEESLVGINSWSISFDGLYVKNDTAFGALLNAYLDREAVDVTIAMPSGKTYAGEGIVTALSMVGPYNAEGTVSGAITGSGELEPTPAPVE